MERGCGKNDQDCSTNASHNALPRTSDAQAASRDSPSYACWEDESTTDENYESEKTPPWLNVRNVDAQ